jgi:hypothetical protein
VGKSNAQSSQIHPENTKTKEIHHGTPAPKPSVAHVHLSPSMPRRIRHIPTRQPALLDFLFFREMIREVNPTATAEPMLNLALSATLTDCISAQILEFGARRAVHVVVFTSEAVLAGV